MLQAYLTEDVKRILDHFRECFGIRIVFYDADNRLVKSGLDQPDCLYCQLVQTLYGPERCMEDTVCNWEKAVTSNALTVYQCHGGLIEAVLPIHDNGCLLGFAMIGQIRPSRRIPTHVAQDWARRHRDGRIRQAFYAQDYVSEKRLESILSLFSIYADYIVLKQLVKPRIGPNLAPVLEYMRAHIHRPMTLQQMAAHFNRSACALSHAFTRQLGKSFKQVYIEMKLSTAEALMRETPDMTIADVAAHMGYRDPFYFSRIYRKYRGVPPSAFLAEQRAP